MQLDRATKSRLGFGSGGYNRAYQQTLNQEQVDRTRAQKQVTNTEPVSESGAQVIAGLMQSVQNGTMSMESAARIINGIK